MPERVLAVDPGPRPGWATATITDDGRLTKVQWGVTPWMEFAAEFHDDQLGGDEAEYDVIVYETWRLAAAKARSMIGDDMVASQLIGVLRLVGRLSGAKVRGYGPDRKKVSVKAMTPAFKEKLAPRFHHEQHSKDALMHLWMYYFDHYEVPR